MSGDSKIFNANNEFDTDTHYGKHVFAQKVVKVNANKIDFSGFSAILTNIVIAIDAHIKKLSSSETT